MKRTVIEDNDLQDTGILLGEFIEEYLEGFRIAAWQF
jgi:hypothetical protein